MISMGYIFKPMQWIDLNFAFELQVELRQELIDFLMISSSFLWKILRKVSKKTSFFSVETIGVGIFTPLYGLPLVFYKRTWCL